MNEHEPDADRGLAYDFDLHIQPESMIGVYEDSRPEYREDKGGPADDRLAPL